MPKRIYNRSRRQSPEARRAKHEAQAKACVAYYAAGKAGDLEALRLAHAELRALGVKGFGETPPDEWDIEWFRKNLGKSAAPNEESSSGEAPPPDGGGI